MQALTTAAGEHPWASPVPGLDSDQTYTLLRPLHKTDDLSVDDRLHQPVLTAWQAQYHADNWRTAGRAAAAARVPLFALLDAPAFRSALKAMGLEAMGTSSAERLLAAFAALGERDQAENLGNACTFLKGEEDDEEAAAAEKEEAAAAAARGGDEEGKLAAT